MGKLEEFYAKRIEHNLLPAEKYREQYKELLEERKLLTYFDSFKAVYALRYNTGCIDGTDQLFDWVAGGPWPGDFALVHIQDCTEACESLQSLILRRAQAVSRGEYAIPQRLHPGLTFPLTTEQLPAVLAQMTALEHAQWRARATTVSVSAYRTQEAPVSVRLTGVDDGVEAGFFRTVQEAEEALRDIARHENNRESRQRWGFIFTD